MRSPACRIVMSAPQVSYVALGPTTDENGSWKNRENDSVQLQPFAIRGIARRSRRDEPRASTRQKLLEFYVALVKGICPDGAILAGWKRGVCWCMICASKGANALVTFQVVRCGNVRFCTTLHA